MMAEARTYRHSTCPYYKATRSLDRDPRIAATKPTVARRLVDALASAPEGSPEREEIAAAIVKALGEGGAVAAELRRIVSALSPPPPPGASAPRAR